ncbi:MAG: xanthine dehydrogenase family protein molybdopterin-binding subunit, partial [Anaerolineales bacterium]|nr:xanthine dehydrogenase family protein molybdopterin-binding subunit [Anaerolineales bacterium]
MTLTNAKPPKSKKRLSRRGFLILSGVGVAAAAGLVVAFNAGRRYLIENFENFASAVDAEPNSWLAVTPEGRVRVFMPKAEMGQGIHTAFQQIVAEELDVPLAQVEIVLGDTTILPPDSRGTNGSNSISSVYPALRLAAAYAREMLKAEAARRLGVAAAALSVAEGVILADGQPTDLTYGALLGGQQIVKVLGEAVLPPLKPVDQYRVIGRPAPRVDLPGKVDGSARYGFDARLPGMAFGKVLKPPTFGATLRAVDLESARGVAGVLHVVREDDFVGVVAETAEAAAYALQQLQLNAEWNQKPRLDQQADVEAGLAPGGPGGQILREAGNAAAALREGRLVEAEYQTPFAAHMMLEPPAALAHVRQADGVWRADVWTSTQGATGLVSQIARAAAVDAKQVVVHPLYLGGGFGRKSVADAALEAARLSKAAGVPVRVHWDRAEELQHGFLRPPTVSRFRAALSAAGRLTGWEHQQASGLVFLGILPAFVKPILGWDFGAVRGAVPKHYAFPNLRITAWMRETPVLTGFWRGLGLLPNTFAVESFMDEAAHAAGADPLAFRLDHLSQDALGQRARRVLERVAQMAGWGTPLPARADGWRAGRGLALCEDVKTVVAQVAEVAVHPATGDVRVERVFCALDCGLAINPDSVKAQVEGNVMWGVSSALVEEATLKDGRVNATNFGDYPVITIRQAPAVLTEIIDNPTEGPYGIGEPPIGPVAPAIGNAIFA